MQDISKDTSAAQKWTRELDDHLRKLAETMATAEIATQVGRKKSAVEKRAGLLRISLAYSKSRWIRWTAEDDAQLKQLAGTMAISEVAETLKRSVDAVIGRGVILGVPVGFQRTPESRQRWDEIKALVSERLSAPQIAQRLGLSLHTLRQRLRRMGMKTLTDGRACPMGRKATSAPRRQQKAPVRRMVATVSRLAKCDGCGLWVVNTFEGWAAHRARLHNPQRKAA